MTGGEGEQPALLYPFTAHWRWTSRDAWEAEIEELAGRFSELDPGARVGFAWRPRPLALTYDRALLRAGLVSVPTEERLPGAVDRWLGGNGPEGIPGLDTDAAGPVPETGDVGRVLVVEAGGGVREWGPEERRQAAQVVREALGLLGARRTLCLVSGCPADPLERAFLEWSLEEGAAVLLAGDREAVGPSFAWSRPTVACLDRERLGRVQSALRSVGGLARLRRRYRRLEALLLPGDVGPESADRELWEALGVRLVSLVAALP